MFAVADRDGPLPPEIRRKALTWRNAPARHLRLSLDRTDQFALDAAKSILDLPAAPSGMDRVGAGRRHGTHPGRRVSYRPNPERMLAALAALARSGTAVISSAVRSME